MNNTVFSSRSWASLGKNQLLFPPGRLSPSLETFHSTDSIFSFLQQSTIALPWWKVGLHSWWRIILPVLLSPELVETGSTPHWISSPSVVCFSLTVTLPWTWASYPYFLQFRNPPVKDYPKSLKHVLMLEQTQGCSDPLRVLSFILLIIHISFSLEITIFSLRGNRLLLFSALCIWIYTHTLTFWSVIVRSVCQGTCVPAEWREATSTHLAYSILDPSF
jgi:hypothetical protein